MTKYDAIAKIMEKAAGEATRHAQQNASRDGWRTLGDHVATVVTAATGDEWRLPFPQSVAIDKVKGRADVKAFLSEHLVRVVRGS